MQIIDNQPISFRSTLETDSDCNLGDRKTYCQLYENGDTLKAQWKADSCSSLECASAPSTNELTNSTFTGNANGWTLANGATYGTNAVDFSPNGSGSQLSQTITLTSGNCYLLVFTVSSYVAGELTPTVGGTVGTMVNANGTYSQVITSAGNDMGFSGNNASDYTIDDIFLYDLACYCSDNGEIFVNDTIDSTNGAICHMSGTASVLTVGVLLTTNRYYGVNILISDRTQGSVRVLAGTSAGEWFDSNGDKTSFITSNGTALTIEMDATFDGCVSFVSADMYPSLSDWEIGLFDLNDVWQREIQTYGGINYLTYNQNYITLQWYVPDELYYTPALAEGCYKICLIDPCLEHPNCVYGNNIFEDAFVDASQWTLDANISIASNLMTFTTDGLGGSQVATATGFTCVPWNNCDITIRINFDNIDGDFEDTDIIVNIGNVAHTVTLTAAVIAAGYVEFTETVTSCNGFSIEFDNTVPTGGQTPNIDISSLFVKVVQSCFFQNVLPDYCSNCISVKAEQPCTVKVNAYCDENSLGFDFTYFSLTTRLRTLFINPYSKQRNENYKFSDGSYYKNFAEKDKVWEVIFDYADEVAHDFIATALSCDHLSLYNVSNFSNNDEFIWLDDSYKPEWDKEGRQKVAQSRIELRKATGQLTNSNCS